MPALRKLLDQIPSIQEQLGSEMNRMVEYSLCKSLAGEKHHAFYEAIKRKLAAMNTNEVATADAISKLSGADSSAHISTAPKHVPREVPPPTTSAARSPIDRLEAMIDSRLFLAVHIPVLVE